MKCQICNNAEAKISWQPWGPDESALLFSPIGQHKPGYPIVKVCDFCKRERVENAKESGVAVRFNFKGQEYCFDGNRNPFPEFLWNGGISADADGMEFEMICRDTPTGHDIVAVVYTAFAPGLADELIAVYNAKASASSSK